MDTDSGGKLFRYGDNAGNIIVIAKDHDVKIRCHDFVVIHASRYFKHAIDFIKKQKTENGEITIKLDCYNANVVKEALCLLYDKSHQPNASLKEEELIQLYDLVDYLQFNCDQEILNRINDRIIESFTIKLNKDNWLPLMSLVFPMKEPFVKAILLFFKRTIINSDNFITDDPLQTLDGNSPLARFMVQNYRAWLRRPVQGYNLILEWFKYGSLQYTEQAMNRACDNGHIQALKKFADSAREH